MTDEQRDKAYEVGREINGMPGGKDIRVYVSISIIRLQDEENRMIYRLFTPDRHSTSEDVRQKMLELFEEMRKEKAKCQA